MSSDTYLMRIESIKTDGVLQNLIVEPAEGENFRVVTGNRRFLALKLLERQGAIDGDYKVPTEIRRNLTNGDGRRIAKSRRYGKIGRRRVRERSVAEALDLLASLAQGTSE